MHPRLHLLLPGHGQERPLPPPCQAVRTGGRGPPSRRCAANKHFESRVCVVRMISDLFPLHRTRDRSAGHAGPPLEPLRGPRGPACPLYRFGAEPAPGDGAVSGRGDGRRRRRWGRAAGGSCGGRGGWDGRGGGVNVQIYVCMEVMYRLKTGREKTQDASAACRFIGIKTACFTLFENLARLTFTSYISTHYPLGVGGRQPRQRGVGPKAGEQALRITAQPPRYHPPSSLPSPTAPPCAPGSASRCGPASVPAPTGSSSSSW